MWNLVYQPVTWLFSGVGVVAASGVIAMVKNRRRAAKYEIRSPETARNARDLLLGTWKGRTIETDRAKGELRSYEVTWNFQMEGDELVCHSPATYIEGEKAVTSIYKLKVRILHNRFLMIDFYNTDQMEINFGSEVLQLSDDGRSFSGRFVAYAPKDSVIIAGTIEGERG